MCAEDCRAQIDEEIPGSTGIRGDLGLSLDGSGRPHVVAPRVSDTCGLTFAHSGGLDAVRDATGWTASSQTWDAGVAIARAGTALAALSETGSVNGASFWLSDGRSSWAAAMAPPFDFFRESTLVTGGDGKLRVIGARMGAGVLESVYAVWDGTWTVDPAPLVPAYDGPVALAGVSAPRIAFWMANAPDGITETLHFGEPLGSASAVVTGQRLATPSPLSMEIATDASAHILTLVTDVTDPSRSALPALTYLTNRDGRWARFVLASMTSKRTPIGKDAYGNDLWSVEETNPWPIAVVVRGTEVRLLYTVNHLSGEMTYTRLASGTRISGGTNQQDLMIAWLDGTTVHQQRLGTGFLHWVPASPFPGGNPPLSAVQVDSTGRIHVIGETRRTPSDCGSTLRYLQIAP